MSSIFKESNCYNVRLSVSIDSKSKNDTEKLLDDVCRGLFVNYYIVKESNNFNLLVAKTDKHDNDAYWNIYNVLNRVLSEIVDNYTIKLEDITKITWNQFNNWNKNFKI